MASLESLQAWLASRHVAVRGAKVEAEAEEARDSAAGGGGGGRWPSGSRWSSSGGEGKAHPYFWPELGWSSVVNRCSPASERDVAGDELSTLLLAVESGNPRMVGKVSNDAIKICVAKWQGQREAGSSQVPAPLILHCAARRGYAQVLALLLERLEPFRQQSIGNQWRDIIDMQDAQGRTALHVAVDSLAPHFRPAQWRAVHLLLDMGANCDAKDNHGLRPLHYACRKGDVIAVKLLLKRGSAMHVPSDGSPVPVMLAPQACREAIDRAFQEKLSSSSHKSLCIAVKSRQLVQDVVARAERPKCPTCSIRDVERCAALQRSNYSRWLYTHKKFPRGVCEM